MTRIAIEGGLWLLAFLLLAFVLERPVFAASLVLGLHALIVLVSRAKERVLREPLVFADLALFTQAFRHPRLYLPYFGVLRAAALAGAGAALIVAGFALEEPMALPLIVWAPLLGLGILLLELGKNEPSLDPQEDTRRFGVVGAMWLYWRAGRGPLPQPVAPFAALRLAGSATPPIVVVQSESFFDVRRLDPGVPAGTLERFDALRAQGQSGRLAVPVWGAYTMRTEFAFLSGIAPAALGVHRFNPYRRFARGGVPTLASALRARGYRTLCLHPYPASFFGRERVFPGLGFDEFLDAAAFAGARRDGPYVADAEITGRIQELLRGEERPLFVFAITMENHGPLHLEGADELAVYLRHLRNADAMLGDLAASLAAKEGVLCVYGDHVPGMPAVYAARSYADSRTDYLVWRGGAANAARVDLAAEALAFSVLERAGLAAAPG